MDVTKFLFKSPKNKMNWDELPEGWKVVKLKEVASSLKGKKPQILSDEYFENSVPYLDIKAIEKKEIRQYADVKSSAIATPQDVLIVWDGARCGWVGTGVAGAAGSTIAIIRPKNINSQYLFYFLKTHFKQLNHDVKGIGIPHLKPELLWGLSVPLPPLSEQIRIAARLDELNARIAAARQKIQRLQATLAHARRSVLNAAVTGELSEGNAHWEEVKLKEVASSLKGKKPQILSDKYFENSVPYLDIKAIEKREIRQYADTKSTVLATSNDILIVWDGFRCGLVGTEISGAAGSTIAVIRPKNINSKYLFYLLKTYFKILNHEVKGIDVKHIKPELFWNLPIPLPPLSEQAEIVRRVEALTAGLSAAESRAARIAAALDALPQALLRQAFSGKL